MVIQMKGSELQLWRELMNIKTVEQAADMLNISKSTWYRYVNGQYQIPQYIDCLCAFYAFKIPTFTQLHKAKLLPNLS